LKPLVSSPSSHTRPEVGTRAVIASKNILIDNSFETKLKEAEQDFQFSL
jgi:hypothetical protein